MKPIFAFVFILLLITSFGTGRICAQGKTDNAFLMIPSLHGSHKINTNYSYDSVRSVINHFSPDIIAVEIRTEDIDSDTTYLLNNYPFEMVMMKYWFPGSKVVGFDWLGAELEGKKIPEGYWKHSSKIKMLERNLDTDSLYSKSLEECNVIQEARLKIVKVASYQQLIKSSDAELTTQYYDCIAKKLSHTPYQPLVDFYRIRNEKIFANIRQIWKKNKGKRILVITGDDHYVYMDHKLSFIN